jgi:hypothetical protein
MGTSADFRQITSTTTLRDGLALYMGNLSPINCKWLSGNPYVQTSYQAGSSENCFQGAKVFDSI